MSFRLHKKAAPISKSQRRETKRQKKFLRDLCRVMGHTENDPKTLSSFSFSLETVSPRKHYQDCQLITPEVCSCDQKDFSSYYVTYCKRCGAMT